MRKTALSWGIAIALMAATGTEALARSVCYSTPSGETFVRVKLVAQGSLTTYSEKRAFDNPLQTTYAATGNTIFLPGPQTAPTYGNVIVAQGKGARMGLSLSGFFAGLNAFQPFECSSREASPMPRMWECLGMTISAQSSVGPQPFRLLRVNPRENESCSAFTLGLS